MMIRSRRGRWTVILFGLISLVSLARLASVDGIWNPMYVAGPSMAPTLWGPAREGRCAGCGATVRVHEHPANPLDERLKCHNCGDRLESAGMQRRLPDRVLVDRAAYWWRAPRHGDLVAIQTEQGTLQVKRVIAVPGDEIDLQQSNLRVNGRCVEAFLPPDSIPSVAVFNAAWRDSSGPRWQDSATGRWSVYHHRSIYDPDGSAPIRDDYPANTAISRQLVPVDHKQISGRFSAAEPAEIEVEIWVLDHRERFRGRFPAGDYSWSVSSLDAEGIPGMTRPTGFWQRLAHDEDADSCRAQVSAEAPIAIRVVNGRHAKQPVEARLSDLLVSRHLRWYVRRGDRRLWPAEPVRLKPQRYFVVGDNLPLSVDSRGAPEGIERSRIVGRVFYYRPGRTSTPHRL